jgi:dCTP deaminase
MILSGQSIRLLCEASLTNPMITPFVPTKQVRNGKSYGLSTASYDLRIAHDLTLGPHPGHVLVDLLGNAPNTDTDYVLRTFAAYAVNGMPPCFALAHTVEMFHMPAKVMGFICDKSTYARFGVSCFHTMFDPGFRGNGTLELVNLSPKLIVIREGDPICQMVFQWLDEAAETPYAGKYQDQPAHPMPAILEEASSTAEQTP